MQESTSRLRPHQKHHLIVAQNAQVEIILSGISKGYIIIFAIDFFVKDMLITMLLWSATSEISAQDMLVAIL